MTSNILDIDRYVLIITIRGVRPDCYVWTNWLMFLYVIQHNWCGFFCNPEGFFPTSGSYINRVGKSQCSTQWHSFNWGSLRFKPHTCLSILIKYMNSNYIYLPLYIINQISLDCAYVPLEWENTCLFPMVNINSLSM